MKTLLSKLPAVLAMGIALISFVFYVQSLFEPISDIWIGSVIMAVLSLPFFLVDAVISLVKAVKKQDTRFNAILALAIIGLCPMVGIFGGSGRDLFNVIWNVYYLMVFVLEILSIKKAVAVMQAQKAGKQN